MSQGPAKRPIRIVAGKVPGPPMVPGIAMQHHHVSQAQLFAAQQAQQVRAAAAAAIANVTPQPQTILPAGGRGMSVANSEIVPFHLAPSEAVEAAKRSIEDHQYMGVFLQLLKEFHQHEMRRVPGLLPSLVNLCKPRFPDGLVEAEGFDIVSTSIVAAHLRGQYKAELEAVDRITADMRAEQKRVWEEQGKFRPVMPDEMKVHEDALVAKTNGLKYMIKQRYVETIASPALRQALLSVPPLDPTAPLAAAAMASKDAYIASAAQAAAAAVLATHGLQSNPTSAASTASTADTVVRGGAGGGAGGAGGGGGAGAIPGGVVIVDGAAGGSAAAAAAQKRLTKKTGAQQPAGAAPILSRVPGGGGGGASLPPPSNTLAQNGSASSQQQQQQQQQHAESEGGERDRAEGASASSATQETGGGGGAKKPDVLLQPEVAERLREWYVSSGAPDPAAIKEGDVRQFASTQQDLTYEQIMAWVQQQPRGSNGLEPPPSTGRGGGDTHGRNWEGSQFLDFGSPMQTGPSTRRSSAGGAYTSPKPGTTPQQSGRTSTPNKRKSTES